MTAVTLPTGLADTRSQPLQRKEGLSTKGRGRVGRLGRLDFGDPPSGVQPESIGASSTSANRPDWQCQTTAAPKSHRCPPHRNSGLGLKSGLIQGGSFTLA